MSNRENIVKNIKSKYQILMPNGEEIWFDPSNKSEAAGILDQVGDEELRSYVFSEEVKGQPHQEPPSIKMMQKLELIDYEPASDSGNLRFYPKGSFLFNLLKRWADEIALNRLNAMQIESPLLYNWNDAEIQSQAGSFHENHYQVSCPDDPAKEFILRFAGDFGLFKIMKNARFSHKMLPLRIYEFSKSFRYEKRGALSGLKRLRAFHIPDIHSFCQDINQGWDEYKVLYQNYADLANGIGVPYAIGFRIVEGFYHEHKQRILELINYSKRPAFIEVLSEMKHYWVVKHEFQGIDSVNGNVQLSTVQLDIKDSDLYGIGYIDADGAKKGCIICHSSIGSLERWIYCILEQALKYEKPCLPLWLCPAQLRLIPVSGEYVDYCNSLQLVNIRVEIDDCNESLGKKIARAHKAWIPYVAVVGENERKSDMLMINQRVSGQKRHMSVNEIQNEIHEQCSGLPFEPLPMPKHLSLRPVFRG